MTPLRQRMTNDMTVRGLAENTKRSYLTSVRNGPRELDSVVSEIFLGFQAAKSR